MLKKYLMPQWKKLPSGVINASIFIITLSLGFLFLELFVRYNFFSAEDRAMGIRNIADFQKDSYVREIMRLENATCGLVSLSQAHPYFGYIYKTVGRCASAHVNNRGFITYRDIPSERDPTYFTILMVGGSVADQMANGLWARGSWLEKILNENYRSPNGRPFRVLDAAAGGWMYPNQLTATFLFGTAVDAVVAIDGYNEAVNIKIGAALDLPNMDVYYQLIKPPVSSFFASHIEEIAILRAQITQLPLLRDSFFVHYFVENSIKAAYWLSNFPSLRYEAVGRYIDYPADWSNQKKESRNILRYGQYVRMLAGLSRDNDLLFAHFLQPIRWIDKPLTPVEASYMKLVDERQYLLMSKELDKIRKKGVATFSLLHVFSGVKEELYGDHIHCKRDSTGDSLGYRIMSKAIASKLATQWKLKRK